jgi:hypothetical protein
MHAISWHYNHFLLEETSSDRPFTDLYESHAGGFADGLTHEISLHKFYIHITSSSKNLNKQSTKRSLKPQEEIIASSVKQ